MAQVILAGPLFPKSFLGAECASCDCPVYWVCDCDYTKCLLEFSEQVICNAKNADSSGYPLWQVIEALETFQGFAFYGLAIAPSYDYDGNTGTPTVDFGRSYIRSQIKDYGVTPDRLRQRYLKVLRIIDPGASVTSNCNQCDNPYCNIVHCLLQTLRDFINLNEDERFRGDIDLFVRPDLCCDPDKAYCGECPEE